jgi:hypothetical protein
MPGTVDGPTTTESLEYRVPRLLRAAEAWCADGRVLRGRVFLPASAPWHAGAMRADEWVNEPDVFIPFLPDGEGRPVILNKSQLVVLTVATADSDVEPGEATARAQRVSVECGALRLVGDVVLDLPEGHARVLDLLNRPAPFLALRDGDRRHLVRKAAITRVSEAAAPADAR